MDYCSSISCPKGNCPGCKDGKVWCQDPRCEPYCMNCGPPDDFKASVIIFLITLIILGLVMAFVVFMFYGMNN
jgi:uncharacterized protein (DUF983 family)